MDEDYDLKLEQELKEAVGKVMRVSGRGGVCQTTIKKENLNASEKKC